MQKIRIAIPSEGEGGLNGTRSSHFGHCDVFTIIDCANGKIEKVQTVRNQDHTQGGCSIPVNLLVENKVDALLVGGIGMRPLMSAHQAGIKVFHETKRMEILPVVEDLIAGKIPEINDNQVCGGGSHHHVGAGL